MHAVISVPGRRADWGLTKIRPFSLDSVATFPFVITDLFLKKISYLFLRGPDLGLGVPAAPVHIWVWPVRVARSLVWPVQVAHRWIWPVRVAHSCCCLASGEQTANCLLTPHFNRISVVNKVATVKCMFAGRDLQQQLYFCG